MGFQELRSLKKNQKAEKTIEHFKVLVVGQNFFTRKSAKWAIGKFGCEQVRVIWGSDPFDESSWKVQSSWPLLGDEGLKVVEKLAPECLLETEIGEAKFFKEGQFFPFTARKKPEPLLYDEPVFQSNMRRYDFKKVGGDLSEDEPVLVKTMVKSIARPKSVDLGKVSHWEVTCENGDRFSCEHLICTLDPKSFLNLLESPDEFSDSFHQMCSNERVWQSLQIYMELDQVWIEDESIKYFAQSLTHEWGHFVAMPMGVEEVNDQGMLKKRQKIVFFCYLPQKEMTEEDISKKIRLLKRVLERVYPQFGRSIVSEKIFLNPAFPSLEHGDSLWAECHKEFPHLYFVDAEGPINKGDRSSEADEVSYGEIHFFARALMSFNEMQRQLQS